MKLKINKISLLLCALLLNMQLSFAYTPKPMAENVHNLTQAAAVLKICFESASYKKLPAEVGLEMHELWSRITNLVKKITDYYNDDGLYLTYEQVQVEMSSDPEMIEFSKNEYQYCSSKLLEDMEVYVTESEKQINAFLE